MFRFLKILFAFGGLIACGGEDGSFVTGIPSTSPPAEMSYYFNGMRVEVTEVAIDGSYIVVQTGLENLAQYTSVSLKLLKQPDGSYLYENGVIRVSLADSNHGTGSGLWEVLWERVGQPSLAEIYASLDSPVVEFSGNFDLSAGGAGVLGPNTGNTGNFYPLIRYDREYIMPSHYNFTITSGDNRTITLVSNANLEISLTYNPNTKLYELNESEGPYEGYFFTYDPVSSELKYHAPVLVNSNHLGDTSGLIKYYGYDAIVSSIKDTSIDFSSLHIVESNADFTEGSPSAANVESEKDRYETLFKDYKSLIEDNNGVWDSGANINFGYASLNVEGLEASHLSGWSGLGSTIRIIDEFPNGSDVAKVNNYGFIEFTHGANTYAIARAIAPEASFVLDEFGGSDGNYTATNSFVDAVNVSLGRHITDAASLADGNINALRFITETLQPIASRNPNAVIIESAGNNGGTSLGGLYGCSTSGSRVTAASCTDIKFALDDAYYSDLDRTIFVGAYDELTSGLTDYSVSAGYAFNHFIVADGGSILDSGRGTSYAAPRVTGALGLISQKFPELTPQQKKKLILHTADDLGEPGVDYVFGHGKLNVGAALSPVGKLH